MISYLHVMSEEEIEEEDKQLDTWWNSLSRNTKQKICALCREVLQDKGLQEHLKKEKKELLRKFKSIEKELIPE